MSNLLIKRKRYPKEYYDTIPVYYCMDCLSLKVMNVAGMDDACFCDDCGGTDVRQSSIQEWEKLYEQKYGFKFLNNSY